MQDAQAGDCETSIASAEDGGGVGGLLFVCPGCRAIGSLPTKGPRAWTVVEGDVSQPETLTHYTDVAGCERVVTVDHVDGVRVERDVLTERGREQWARRVEAVRKRTKDGE